MRYPLSITHHATVRELRIDWDDGTQQRFSAQSLRQACQCAHCKTHRIRTGKDIESDEAIDINDMSLVGGYGVQLIFSDGHDRGIYPWAYLRSIS